MEWGEGRKTERESWPDSVLHRQETNMETTTVTKGTSLLLTVKESAGETLEKATYILFFNSPQVIICFQAI